MEREAAKRDAALVDRNAAEGDPAPLPSSSPDLQPQPEPVAEKGIDLGTDLTLPLVALTAVVALTLAARSTMRALRQD